jgi:CheY-like chemotaxis protein
MGGRELAEALAPLVPRMRVLYVSGYTENAIVQQGALEPGIDFLAKPFSPDQLGTKVKEILTAPLRPKSILLVDDEKSVRDFMGFLLKDAGYDVAVASDGSEAVSICRHKPVDLLITDLIMPGQEGLETIKYFKKQLPHVPIIAMSGAFSGEFLPIAKQLGAREALQKPVEAAEVLRTVRGVIG